MQRARFLAAHGVQPLEFLDAKALHARAVYGRRRLARLVPGDEGGAALVTTHGAYAAPPVRTRELVLRLAA